MAEKAGALGLKLVDVIFLLYHTIEKGSSEKQEETGNVGMPAKHANPEVMSLEFASVCTEALQNIPDSRSGLLGTASS